MSSRWRLRPRRSGLFRLIAALTLTGCTVALDFDDCDADTDCARFGPGVTCEANRCVAPSIETYGDLLTYPCTHVYGVDPNEPFRASTHLIGVILPFSGELEAYGTPIDQGIELAVAEINKAGGVFGRDLAVVSCDSGTESAVAVEAAQYLVERVGVPAIIGAAASSVTLDVFNQVAKSTETLLISPASTATVLTDLPDAGLLWRTAPSDAGQGAAIASYLLAEEFQKVAMIARDDTYGTDLSNAIQSTLCSPDSTFNCADKERYFTAFYTESTEETDQSSALIAMKEDGFVPEVIVLISYHDDGIAFMNLADAEGHRRFILTDGTRSADLVGQVPDAVLCQVVGTSPASPAGEAYQGFVLRFRGRFDGKDPGTFAANAYDALYLLGYALAGLNSETQPTGSRLAEQLLRFSEGEEVPVGTSVWNAVIQTLRNNPNASIDFQGASGKLDFDAKTGEARSNIEAWTFDLDKDEVASLGVIYTAEGEYLALEAPIGQGCTAAEGAPE